MEVSCSFGRIEKFSRRPCTISLREFKVTFSIVVFELELKYGVNYTEAFAFKQLARYVHYEASDVYEDFRCHSYPQSSLCHTIAIASQAALQAAITHHWTMPNNPNLVLISVNISPQQLIVVIAKNPPSIDALAFANPMVEFFRILELKFSV